MCWSRGRDTLCSQSAAQHQTFNRRSWHLSLRARLSVLWGAFLVPLLWVLLFALETFVWAVSFSPMRHHGDSTATNTVAFLAVVFERKPSTISTSWSSMRGTYTNNIHITIRDVVKLLHWLVCYICAGSENKGTMKLGKQVDCSRAELTVGLKPCGRPKLCVRVHSDSLAGKK